MNEYAINDKVIFDNRYTLKFNFNTLEGLIVGTCFNTGFFVKTKYGITYVDKKDIIEKV